MNKHTKGPWRGISVRLIKAAPEMYDMLVKLASKDANEAGPEELQKQIEDARDLLARIDEGERDE